MKRVYGEGVQGSRSVDEREGREGRRPEKGRKNGEGAEEG